MHNDHMPMGVPYRDALILLACSRTKIQTKEAQAFQLYDGPMWRTLRATIGADAAHYHNVFVLSGKYAFIPAVSVIQPYNQMISSEKVGRFIDRGIYAPNDHFGAICDGLASCSPYVTVNRWENPYKAVIIAGSGEYRRAFDWLAVEFKRVGLVAPSAPVVATAGGIGSQRHQLATFIKQLDGLAIDGAALSAVEQVA